MKVITTLLLLSVLVGSKPISNITPVFKYKSPLLYEKIFVDANHRLSKKLLKGDGYRLGFLEKERDIALLQYDTNLLVTNYYFVGKQNEKGYSERYNVNSPMFQSWFGLYVIKSKEKLTVKYLLNKIVLRDQRTLLKYLSQIEKPTLSVKDNAVKVVTLISEKDTIFKVDFTMLSSLDKGWCRDSIFHLFKTKENIWNGYLKGDEIVELPTTLYIRYHSSNLVSIIYFNGVSFTDLKEVIHETYPVVFKEYYKMIGELEFKQIN